MSANKNHKTTRQTSAVEVESNGDVFTQSVNNAMSSLLLNGRNGASSQGTALNSETMKSIDNVLLEDGIVDSLLRKISRRVFAGGITFQLTVGGNVIDLDNNIKNLIDQFWLPELKHILLNIQKYGVAPVIFTAYKKPNGDVFLAPKVPMEGTYTISFKLDDNSCPHYSLHRNSPPSKKNASKKLSTQFGYKWENSMVFEHNRPSVDGRINSVVLKTLPYVNVLNTGWKVYCQAVEEMANVPYVHVKTATKREKTRVEGPDDIPFGESDLSLDKNDEKKKLDDDDREALLRARQMSAASNMQRTTEKFDMRTQRKTEELMPDPWITRKYDLPDGVALSSSVPRASTPAGITNVHRIMIDTIASILEVPDSIGRGSTQRMGSNANFSQTQFDQVVEAYRSVIKEIGEKMFYHIYDNQQTDFLKNVVEIVESFHGDSLNDDQLRNLTGEINVDLIFNTEPDIDYPMLKQLYNDGIIPAEEYKKRTLALFGICEDGCEEGTFAKNLFQNSEPTVVQASAANKGDGYALRANLGTESCRQKRSKKRRIAIRSNESGNNILWDIGNVMSHFDIERKKPKISNLQDEDEEEQEYQTDDEYQEQQQVESPKDIQEQDLASSTTEEFVEKESQELHSGTQPQSSLEQPENTSVEQETVDRRVNSNNDELSEKEESGSQSTVEMEDLETSPTETE